MPTVYAILNQQAKRWWYHAALRQQGRCQEARTRERQYIRDTARSLRETIHTGGYLSIGRGGTTLHCSDRHRVECQWYDEAYHALARRLHIPIVDTRSVPDDRIVEVAVSWPMACVDPRNADPPPYGSFSHAPLPYMLGRWKAVGATIENALAESASTLETLHG